MKRWTPIVVLAATLPVQAHDPDRVIEQASDLVAWCKAEAEAHYIAQGVTPYQWTASYHDRSNVLYVDGKLRADGRDVAVQCRIARGAREQHGIIEIDGKAP